MNMSEMGSDTTNSNKETDVHHQIDSLEEYDVTDNINQISPHLIQRILDLQKLQEEEELLHLDYKRERLALEQKYNQLRKWKYMKRLDIVNAYGNHRPVGVTDQQISSNNSNINTDTRKTKVHDSNSNENTDIGVPGFWLQVLANHPIVGQYIEEGDVDALTSLQDISCEYNEEMSTFTLIFIFKDNIYFKNKYLKKSYTVTPDLLDDRSPALLSATCPERVDWTHPELVLTANCTPHPINGHPELIAKTSFFHYFEEPEPLKLLTLPSNSEDSENIPVGIEIEMESETGTRTNPNLDPHAPPTTAATGIGIDIGLPNISMSALPEVSIDMQALNATYDTIRSSVLSISDELFRPSFGLFRGQEQRQGQGYVYESASVTLMGLGGDGPTQVANGQLEQAEAGMMNGNEQTAILFDNKNNTNNNTNSGVNLPRAQLIPTSPPKHVPIPSATALNLLQHPINDAELYKLSIKTDYEISHIIRTVLIPNAVGWYTGELIEEEEV